MATIFAYNNWERNPMELTERQEYHYEGKTHGKCIYRSDCKLPFV